jgi:hypothetical protein
MQSPARISWDALGLEVKPVEIDHHRGEPRWIFARFHLNVTKPLAEATPVQTSPREGEILDLLVQRRRRQG